MYIEIDFSSHVVKCYFTVLTTKVQSCVPDTSVPCTVDPPKELTILIFAIFNAPAHAPSRSFSGLYLFALKVHLLNSQLLHGRESKVALAFLFLSHRKSPRLED